MDKGVEALKAEMLEKFRKGLEEITAKPLGNLDQMEEAVGRFKTELGRETTEGYVSYKRMRYQCRKCSQGFYPLDLNLELSKKSRMSRRKESQLTRLAARLPYEEAEEVYEELTYQKTGSMTIHRRVQALGKKVVEKAPQLPALEDKGKRHGTADGTMIHIRGEGWKETLVGAVYNVNEDREATEVLYATELGKREKIGQELYRLAGEPEAEETKGMAFVSDAANWLDEMQQLQFPLATRIVDQWHASEYLWKTANEFYGQGSRKAKEWAEEKVEALKAGKQRSLKQALERMQPKTAKQKEVLKDTKRYFRNHGSKRAYPRYKKRGFHVGSGVAEGACK